MTGEQNENNLLWQQVEKKVKLSMYGEFMTLLDVSRNYTIPQDDVYKMPTRDVYGLVVITKKTEYGQSKLQELKRTLQPNPPLQP